ncbi:hypothetical protein [Shewanella gelidii]|uniref:hypothetical protein n=1 Tax=Shewanella gelidii TaxID=1642821 RepID=UPI001665D2A8|nr:hypothetical protein [Shewanella gelidii]MCL1097366.1 hypothetical protein [Shewanella gelidii]
MVNRSNDIVQYPYPVGVGGRDCHRQAYRDVLAAPHGSMDTKSLRQAMDEIEVLLFN